MTSCLSRFFAFFITNKVPEYFSLFVNSGTELPWVVKIFIMMADIIRNWSFALVPLFFLFLFSIIFTVLFTGKVELLTKVNIILTAILLIMCAVFYLRAELYIRELLMLSE